VLFNTPEYGIFLLVALAIFWVIQRHLIARLTFLLAASYLFYGAWNPVNMALIAFVTLINFGAGLLLSRVSTHRGRKGVTASAAALSLGLLGIFKYLGFLGDSINVLMQLFHLPASVVFARPELPVGISFYTFQCLSYTVDVYRRQVEPCRSPLDFALYASFFPLVLAGPIMRADQLLPQLRQKPVVDEKTSLLALAFILAGLMKKMVIADVLGSQIVNPVYGNLGVATGLHHWLAFYAFPIQLYCDFSGYCDIAVGSAMLFGIRLVDNFNAPFLAQSLREFWQRWHITLSRWLRDYLYIPLGGNRKGEPRTLMNLLVTMTLGGLWHGASWTYVAWGFYHGALLALERILARYLPFLREVSSGRIAVLVRRVITFHLVALGFVMFRSAGISQAAVFLKGLVLPLGPFVKVPIHGIFLGPEKIGVLLFLAIALHVMKDGTTGRLRERFAALPSPLIALLFFIALQAMSMASYMQAPFIYFQF